MAPVNDGSLTEVGEKGKERLLYSPLFFSYFVTFRNIHSSSPARRSLTWRMCWVVPTMVATSDAYIIAKTDRRHPEFFDAPLRHGICQEWHGSLESARRAGRAFELRHQQVRAIIPTAWSILM